MTTAAISARKTTTIAGVDFVTLTMKRSSSHIRDFVEIEPVRFDGEAFKPVYGDDARGPSRMDVQGPGEFDLKANPAYVRGAYANLRHHQAKPLLKTFGLGTEPGLTHLVPAVVAPQMWMSYDIETDGDGNITGGREMMAMTQALMEAVNAAIESGASHVAIRIS